MNSTSGFYFQSYAEWHQALTIRCGIKLTPDYVRKRIHALEDKSDPDTRAFAEKYGEAYLRQVIRWFQEAEKKI